MDYDYLSMFDHKYINKMNGFIFINKAHFQILSAEEHTDMFNEMQANMWLKYGHAFYYNKNFVVYKNRRCCDRMIYIHNAELIDMPSHDSLIRAGILDKDGVTLDIPHTLFIANTEDIVENIGKNIPKFPFKPLIPEYDLVEVSDKLAKYDEFADEQRKQIIAISIFVILYKCSYAIRKRNNIPDWRMLRHIKGISEVTEIIYFKKYLKEVLELAKEYFITISNDEELTKYVISGTYYTGFITYSKDELCNLHNTFIPSLPYCELHFSSTEINPQFISARIIKGNITLDPMPIHDEYYMDPCIKDLPYLIYEFYKD